MVQGNSILMEEGENYSFGEIVRQAPHQHERAQELVAEIADKIDEVLVREHMELDTSKVASSAATSALTVALGMMAGHIDALLTLRQDNEIPF